MSRLLLTEYPNSFQFKTECTGCSVYFGNQKIAQVAILIGFKNTERFSNFGKRERRFIIQLLFLNVRTQILSRVF